MDNKDWPKVRKVAEQQGWVVVPDEGGFMLLAPDGVGQVRMHKLHSSSDPHALEQTVRRMRRLGFRWSSKQGGRR